MESKSPKGKKRKRAKGKGQDYSDDISSQRGTLDKLKVGGEGDDWGNYKDEIRTKDKKRRKGKARTASAGKNRSESIDCIIFPKQTSDTGEKLAFDLEKKDKGITQPGPSSLHPQNPSTKKRNVMGKRERVLASIPSKTIGSLHHPFPTEYGDHFETPMQAYQDVAGILSILAKRLGRRRKTLRIWDPYYCAGRTPRLLGELGFPLVSHQNEDFYAVVKDGRQPLHDVLVTNPPYSGDHKRRCLEYCAGSGKPWLLLIPNYVATKDYYREATVGKGPGGGGEPFYLVPRTRYVFDHPEGTGNADSPFVGVWFVHAGSYTDDLFSTAVAGSNRAFDIVRSVQELGRRGIVNSQKRLNPRQRRAAKKRKAGS
ncbi:unnamed protein product [Choristocarpus tenellus]